MQKLKEILGNSTQLSGKFKLSGIDKMPFFLIVVFFVFLLGVFQDYLYSILKQTGFYLSESMLYNTFWVFFIPLTIFINQLVKRINPENKWRKLPLNLGLSLVFSILHTLFFTSLFVLVSNLVFITPHRFSSIFKTALSNQFYLVLLWYMVFPMLYIWKSKAVASTSQYPDRIKLKIGSAITTIPTSTIQLITTDKPYSIIYTNNQKILDNTSLKAFEKQLDSTIFLRVHRSTIVNAEYIDKLKSRRNGDYDATLENGQVIRLSRHYRGNWKQLLH